MCPFPPRKKPRNTIRLIVGFVLILSLVTSYHLFLRSPKKDIELLMVYGSEKRAWIEEVTPLFEERWTQNHPETSLRLDFTPLGSRESMLQIVRETVTPTVWSPASSLWIPLMNFLWNEQHPKDAEKGFILVENASPLVLSPIVIGTWSNFKHENNITGFVSLHELATQPDSELKYAHTDPQLSNSGFLSVVLEVSSALGKTPDQLTESDLTNKAMIKWLTELESHAVFYGTSTGFLAEKAVSEGPQALNAFVIYENLIIDSNLYSVDKDRWGEQLEAVYPVEGSIMNDHPYAILQGEWVSQEQKDAAEEFLAFLLSPEIQQKAMASGFRPANPEIPPDPSIFNPDNGVQMNIGVPIHDFRNVDAVVLWRIPDVWLITRRSD